MAGDAEAFGVFARFLKKWKAGKSAKLILDSDKGQLRITEEPVELHIKLKLVNIERFAHQPFGIGPGTFATVTFQVGGRVAQNLLRRLQGLLADTLIPMPPRALKSPSTMHCLGAQAVTMSSRILLTDSSWKVLKLR